MLPAAKLLAAGILMVLGGLLQNNGLINTITALGAGWFQLLATVMEKAGGL